jgi:arsenate reductase
VARVKLLFICVGNAVRSQMAEGFARALGGDRVEARSGGSAPAGFVAPKAVAVMAERGIDISRQESKAIDFEFMAEADAVVSTCHEAQEACPVRFRSDTFQWSIADPVRDEVEGRVRSLLQELGVPLSDEKP